MFGVGKDFDCLENGLELKRLYILNRYALRHGKKDFYFLFIEDFGNVWEALWSEPSNSPYPSLASLDGA